MRKPDDVKICFQDLQEWVQIRATYPVVEPMATDDNGLSAFPDHAGITGNLPSFVPKFYSDEYFDLLKSASDILCEKI